ncbi:MAG: exodeoxyribonuclease V subunit gamma, partial [Comamonas sp.]
MALHGNCTETLADTLMAWMQAHPLEPLEQETVLVQSNGTAEWFKMRMA